MSVVRIPIEKAQSVGRYDTYAAVAIEITETHLRVRHEDWVRIKGVDATESPGNAIRRIAHAGRSIVKTSMGIDLAAPDQIEARLAVCRNCPGGHAIFKDGDVHTCGPMLEGLKSSGKGKPCGCILRKKARDLKEDCPFGYWPRIDVQAVSKPNKGARPAAANAKSHPEHHHKVASTSNRPCGCGGNRKAK